MSSLSKGNFRHVRFGPRQAATLAIFALAGWSLAGTAVAAAPRESLYARMGGTPVVTAIVSDMVDEVDADPRLNQSYRGVNTKRLKRQVVAFICELAGGGCHYTGSSMHDAHANLHITEAEFYDMVAILRRQMVRHHVGLRERNELLAILAPMKHDIVEVNVPPPPKAP
jgi:hemoglobin